MTTVFSCLRDCIHFRARENLTTTPSHFRGRENKAAATNWVRGRLAVATVVRKLQGLEQLSNKSMRLGIPSIACMMRA